MNYLYFDDAMSYGNLRLALNKCCRNVRWKDSVIGYELHAAENTYKLRQDILNGTYKISPYQKFIIYEPKRREIVATRIRDRQAQMALCMGGLYQDITEHFIYDNCACQIGKGTDFALKRVRKHLSDFYRKHKKNGWVLKLDIHHFFQSTRHDVAKLAMDKRISDPKAKKFVFDIIDSFDGDCGIGLGSQISQLIELAVLDDLDHFIKEKLHIKQYIRYMDDLLLIHHDKDYLKECWRLIEIEVNKLGLVLNQKTTMYPLSQGIKFLKWRFVLSETGRIFQKLDRKKLGKERRRLKKLVIREMNGELEKCTAYNSLVAWSANAKRGDGYFQVKNMEQYFIDLFEKGDINDYSGRTVA